MVREEGAEAGEAGVDALHAPPLVRVGDLAPDPLLLHVHLQHQHNFNPRIRVMVLISDGHSEQVAQVGRKYKKYHICDIFCRYKYKPLTVYRTNFNQCAYF